MTEKPLFATDYKREDLELVRQTCLYVATKLGDLLDDLVVVGGLVPSLLIPDESLPAGEDVHIGTTDLDLGLSLAILDTKRYEDLSLRLNRADFKPDEKRRRQSNIATMEDYPFCWFESNFRFFNSAKPCS